MKNNSHMTLLSKLVRLWTQKPKRSFGIKSAHVFDLWCWRPRSGDDDDEDYDDDDDDDNSPAVEDSRWADGELTEQLLCISCWRRWQPVDVSSRVAEESCRSRDDCLSTGLTTSSSSLSGFSCRWWCSSAYLSITNFVNWSTSFVVSSSFLYLSAVLFAHARRYQLVDACVACSLHPPKRLCFISVCLSVRLSVCLSVCLFICL